MAVSSVRPADLDGFVRDSAAVRNGLVDSTNAAIRLVRQVAAGCSFGHPSSHGLSGLGTAVESMGVNDSFVAQVSAAAVAADNFANGVAVMPDSMIEDRLRRAGLINRPGAVSVAEMEMFGLVPTSGFVDDPVCAANGNFVHGDEDLVFPAFSRLLNVTRMYNSLAHGRCGVFGRGWTSTLDVRLAELPSGQVHVTLADGAVVVFEPQGDGAYPFNLRRRLALERREEGWELIDGDRVGFQFDRDGLLRSIVSAGASVGLEWAETSVRLSEARSGRWVDFAVDGGLVREVRSSDGRICRYTFDGELLVAVERVIGPISYEYVDHLLVSVIDADAVRVCTNTFDELGRVLAQTNHRGRATTYTYQDSGLTTVVGDNDQVRNTFVHDRWGNLTSMFDGEGRETRLVCDVSGLVRRVTDRCGASTEYEFGPVGELLARVDPDGIGHQWVHDDAGRLVEETDRAGAVTRYEYEGSSRQPSVVRQPDGTEVRTAYDDRSLPVSVTDADGVTTAFEWDADGQLVAVIDAAGGRTEFRYDSAGRALGATNPSGVWSRLELDPAGRVRLLETADGVEEYDYTSAGRVSGGSSPAGARWAATFDRTGEVVHVTDGAGGEVAIERDLSGNIVVVSGPDGAVYRQRFDRVGRLVAAVDPLGNTTEVKYDPEGRQIAVTDAAGRCWTRQVDLLGRTTSVTLPSGSSLTRSYHPNGGLAEHTDEMGAVWSQAVDALGRVVRRVDPAGSATEFAYTAAGRLGSVADPLGAVESYRYDAAGRLESVKLPDGTSWRAHRRSDGKTVSIEHGELQAAMDYDGTGRLTSFTAAQGSSTSHWVGGRPVSALTGDARSTFEWDPRGLLALAVDPAGVVTEFARNQRGLVVEAVTGESRTSFDYDACGWMTALTDGQGNRTDIDRDAVGLISRVLYPDGGSVEFSRNDSEEPDLIHSGAGELLGQFERDAAGRIVTAVAPDCTVEFERDIVGRVVRCGDGRSSIAYQWDATGALASRSDGAGGAVTIERDLNGAPTVFVTSTGNSWDAPDSERTIDRDQTGRVSVDEEGRVYRYDDAGRLSEMLGRQGESRSYRYNRAGFLSEEDGPEGPRRYEYGVCGELLRVESGDDATELSYDLRGRRILERRDDGSTVSYTWNDLDQLRSVVRTRPDGSATVDEVRFDAIAMPVELAGVDVVWDRGHSGRVIGLGDQRFIWCGASFAPVESGEWSLGLSDDPWGDDGLSGVRLGFRGELCLDNLVFLGARVYDTHTKVFLSRDPAAPVAGQLLYAGPYGYAANDPVNLVDPTGLRPLSDADYAAVRDRLEKGTFEKAWDAMRDDPWGTIAMVGVVTVGAVLCFTPLAPIGAGILIGAAIAGGAGLATGNFNPRTVAIAGVAGGATGGIMMAGAGVAATAAGFGVVGGGGSVADQTIARGRGLDEVDPREVLIAAVISAGSGGVARHMANRVPAQSTALGQVDDRVNMTLSPRVTEGAETPIYRGVARDHHAFSAAREGTALPGDVAGHAHPGMHNRGATPGSRLTSWTTRESTARGFAREDGIILETTIEGLQRRGVRILTSPDNFREAEVLVEGVVRNVRVR